MAPGRSFGRCTTLALLALVLGACHGRPLLTQMAPGSDRRATAQRGPERRVGGRDRRDLERYSRARKLFEGPSPYSPVENVMQGQDFRRLADAQARRDPRISEPRVPETFVQRGVREALENPAKPSFENPEKAFRPGEICLDPIMLTLLAIKIMRDPDAFREGFRESYRKDKPGR